MKPHRFPVNCGSLCRTAVNYATAADFKYVNKAQSGKDNFAKDFENSHVRTTLLQKILLGVGSGVISITSPSRGDMIAVMGEVTGYQALEYIQSKMLESDEGRRILEEKPRISSASVDLEKLKKYPEDTLGKAYSNFLEKYGYTPDTRNAVRFVDDVELAYVAQRYRESHDLFHTVLDMPTNMLGEVTVKWVEAIQTGLPMCAAGALFGSMRLAPKFCRTYCTKMKTIIEIDSSLSEQIESGSLNPKSHPGVMHLKNISLEKPIENAIYKIVKPYNRKELNLAAQTLRNTLHSRHLPIEKYEREMKRKELYLLLREKYPKDLDDETIQQKLQHVIKQKMLSEIYQWKPIKYDKFNSLKYLVARAPADYAVLIRVFNEIYKRDQNFQPKTLMDFGSGIGTVTWAAHNYWGNSMKEYYCIDASGEMNELAALILRDNDLNNESLINKVYYRQFLPATPKPYDIVVSAFSFFELSSCEQRMRVLTTLWNNTKDYLVLIENGSMAGFTIITEAREYILSVSKKFNVDCYIFAPCPHELECPRHFAPGKKSPCNFFIQYKKLKLRKMSTDTAIQTFSFLIFKKGQKPPEGERQCRIIRKVVNRGSHVVCRLCTNNGELLELYPSASKYGKPTFLCMKKSTWGDIVPGVLTQKLIECRHRKFLPKETTQDGEYKSDSDSEDSDDSITGDDTVQGDDTVKK